MDDYIQLFLLPDLMPRFWHSAHLHELRKLEYENIAKLKGVSKDTHITTQCSLFCDAASYLVADRWTVDGKEKNIARVVMDGGAHEFLLVENTVVQSWWKTHSPTCHLISKQTAQQIRSKKPFDYAEVIGPLQKEESYEEFDVYFPNRIASNPLGVGFTETDPPNLLSYPEALQRYEQLP